MQFDQLQNILRVATTGNLTRAASQAFLSQPALSRQIASLEKELGIALFERSGRGMRLTEAGSALCDYARRTFALLDECRAHLDELKTGAIGKLTVGSGVTAGIFQLPNWLRRFRATFPAVDITVRTGTSHEIMQMTLDRTVDIGLVTSPVDHRELCATTLFEDEIVLVRSGMACHGPQRVKLTPAQFSETPLILFPRGTGFREYLDRALLKAGLNAKVKMEIDSLEAIKSFVGVGLGMSFLPAIAVAAETRKSVLKQQKLTGLPRLRRCTTLIYRVDRHLSAAGRTCVRQILDSCNISRTNSDAHLSLAHSGTPR